MPNNNPQGENQHTKRGPSKSASAPSKNGGASKSGSGRSNGNKSKTTKR